MRLARAANQTMVMEKGRVLAEWSGQRQGGVTKFSMASGAVHVAKSKRTI
jgi:hypothetical protein